MRAKSKVEEWMNSPGEATGSEGEEEDEARSDGSEDGGEGAAEELDLQVIDRKVFKSKTGDRISFLNKEIGISAECEHYLIGLFLRNVAEAETSL
jgi:hypothetical protein